MPALAMLAKSPYWPPNIEQLYRDIAPKLEYHMWEGVSHFLMMEKTDKFIEVLEAFLDKNGLLKK